MAYLRDVATRWFQNVMMVEIIDQKTLVLRQPRCSRVAGGEHKKGVSSTAIPDSPPFEDAVSAQFSQGGMQAS